MLALIEESDFELIEALAIGIAGLILQDSRIEQTTVRIDKPGALRFAQASAVEITVARLIDLTFKAAIALNFS